jgi:hypothetical protein
MKRPGRQAVAVALTELERAVLDFERSWWTEDGVKDVLLAERLGLDPSRYYQLLNELLDRDDALGHDPLTVRRLRRLRERKRRARLEGRVSAARSVDG